MRISSPFKDVYDSGLWLSEDEGLFWRRVEKAYSLPSWRAPQKDVPPNLVRLIQSISVYASHRAQPSSMIPYDLYPIMLIAGRKWWTGYRVIDNPWCRKTVDSMEHRDIMSGPWTRLTKTIWSPEAKVEGLTISHRESIRSGELNDGQTALTYALDCPLYLFDAYRQDDTLVMNPCLKARHVQHTESPIQIAQEIKMWFGNRASKDDTPIKIADKDRVAQHGFDKWSFRKQPKGFE